MSILSSSPTTSAPQNKTDYQKLEEPYRDAYDAWRLYPNKQTAGSLLRALEPEVKRGVMAFGARDPLAKSQAKKIALSAVRTYDPSQSKLGTHIFNHMQGLSRFERKRQQVMSVPERMQLERGRILDSQSRFIDERGREPTLEELADSTGLSTKRIRRVLDLQMGLAEGQTRRVDEEGESSGMDYAADDLGPGSDVWLKAVYQDLDPYNKKIMEWSFGWNGQPVLANQEIARRLGISPGAVSQRKAVIQRVLDQEQEISPF